MKLALDLARRGHDVRLWLQGRDRPGLAGAMNQLALPPDVKLSPDVPATLHGAEVVIVNLHRDGVASIMEHVLARARDHMLFVFFPGYCGGAIHLHNTFKKKRADLNVYVSEIAPTGTWADIAWFKDGKGLFDKSRLLSCSYPEYNNQYVDFVLKNLFPRVDVVDDIKITSLLNFTTVIVPAIILFSLASITTRLDDPRQDFHLIPEMTRLAGKIDGERCLIMERLGVDPVPIPRWMQEHVNRAHVDFHAIFADIDALQLPGIEAARDDLDESITSGLQQFERIARATGVETPAIDALLGFWNVLTESPRVETGQDLEWQEALLGLVDEHPARTVEPRKQSVDPAVNAIFTEILALLKQGWIFVKSPLKFAEMLKEIIYESTECGGLCRTNWIEFYSSTKSGIVIAVTKKTKSLEEKIGSGKDFDTFSGVILEEAGTGVKVTPVFFHDEKDATTYLNGMKEEVKAYLGAIMNRARDPDAKQVNVRDYKKDAPSHAP